LPKSGSGFAWIFTTVSSVNVVERDVEHVEKAFDFAGMGARNGVTAALMVQLGFTGVEDVLEGEHNALEAHSREPKPEEMARDLGTREVAAAMLAQTEAAKSQQVAQFLKDMLQGLGPSVTLGRDPTMVRELLDRAANRIDRDLANQPEIAIELWTTLAATYGELGLHDKMEELAHKNLELARSTFGDENLAVANALHQLGEAQFFREKTDEAETLTREAPW
jgi:tetratricopeptide (TPR) repeat protein